MALFQQNSGSGSGSKNLVEFKCGKMSLSGTTVTADKRKGLLYIYRYDFNKKLCFFLKPKNINLIYFEG